MINVYWHWHSFVEISDFDWSILIDPYIVGNQSCEIDINKMLEKSIKSIIITHGHMDHVWNALDIAIASNCVIIWSFELINYINKVKWYSNTCSMHIGWTVDFDWYSIKLVNAIHGNWIEELWNWRACSPCWVVVRIWWKNIYHAWDTALTYDMKLLWDYDNIDVAFLPIWNVFTMWINDANIASSFIRPKYVVPIHYNTFEQINADPIEFSRLVMSQNIWVIPKVLNPWQYICLETI